MEAETLDQIQSRHRRELKDLQGRITNKKKNASKKTRKGVNEECAEMERQLKEKQAAEIAALDGEGDKEKQDISERDEEEPAQQNETTELEDAIAKIQVAESNSSQNQQNQQQQQQQGKKRNRQKERLARRAAEQEAATQRAEEEASSMTDHRAKESTYIKNAFSTHGLVEKEINPDGHCLFSAVADQLGQNAIPLDSDADGKVEPAYKTVRRAAAEYMASHADDFAPFLGEEDNLEGYVRKMRDTAEWGGELELTALARRYGVCIRVIQDGRTEAIGEEENGEGKKKKTLWLAYYRHGYGLGEHYNSLRKATTINTKTTATATANTD